MTGEYLKCFCGQLFNETSTSYYIFGLQFDNIQNGSFCLNCTMSYNISRGINNCTNVPCSGFHTTPTYTTLTTVSTVLSTTPTMPPTNAIESGTKGPALDILLGTVTALLAAAVIILVTGWTCTCVIMKRGQVTAR